MRGTRLIVMGILVAGCASAAATNVRTPLAASLLPGAKTGPTVPLRFDPNARVILSNATDLPPASYHPSQAARGKGVYENSCGTCHEPGQFVGPAFVEQWNDRRVWDFYALVRSTMPLDNPGGMKDQEYLDVVAYLLQANNAPPGVDSLKVDTASMRRHKIAVRVP
jgi:mono/diheme cytochrome c family protein